MRIKKITRTSRLIHWEIEQNLQSKGKKAEDADTAPWEASKKDCNAAPLPDFDKTLQALVPVACAWMDCVHGTKKEPGWEQGLTIEGITISYTSLATRSVEITYSRHFSLQSAGDTKKYTTPAVRIDKAHETEEKKTTCTDAHKKRIALFLVQAEKYIQGKRAQGLLWDENPAGAEGDDDDENQGALDV